ncbi:hypothetical protein ACJX0J_005643, partial [Zea mays]
GEKDEPLNPILTVGAGYRKKNILATGKNKKLNFRHFYLISLLAMPFGFIAAK